MTETTVKTRFAPSPSGEMHLGNARTALFNYLYAGAQGGTFVLRIEDTDAERCRPEHAQALLRDLRWLGLDWQEGPQAGGSQGPYFQAQRSAIYADFYQRLQDSGAVYPCFCSDTQLKLARKAQRAAGRPPRYPGTCAQLAPEEVARRMAAGARPTLRFRVPRDTRIDFLDLVRGPQSFNSDDIGDFIVRRSDATPAFFFSNAVDDALMGVTHVLRGEDHLTNTPRQLLLLQALGLPAPTYGHLSLLVGEDGSPLSKRHGSQSVRQLRETGYLPAALLNYLARLGHSYGDEAYAGRERLAAEFSLARLGRAPARFDPAQLRHWQKEAVAAATERELVDWCLERLGAPPEGCDEHRLGPLVGLVRDNIEMPQDVAAWARRLCGAQVPPAGEAERAALCAAGSEFFATALQLAAPASTFGAFAKDVGTRTGRKGKALYMPLRIALSGVMHGPEMGRIWEWLGAQRRDARLRAALEQCRQAEAAC